MHPLKAITALAIIIVPVRALPKGLSNCAFSSYDGCFRMFKAACVNGCKSQPMDRWLVCISLCDADIERSCAEWGCLSGWMD